MVGSARRSGPKIQAQSAVCEEHANSNAVPKQRQLQPMRCASPSWQAAAKMGRLGDPSLPWAFRWALPRRLRGGCATVPLGRVGSPQRTQTSGAKRLPRGACKCERATKQMPLQPMHSASPLCQASQKMGRRLCPAEKLPWHGRKKLPTPGWGRSGECIIFPGVSVVKLSICRFRSFVA